tara:strand:- start:451 stop:1122 length:672 start_codon:yes stop_codon:yes gene_type:complete
MQKVKIEPGPLKGLYIATPHVFSDDRGCFFESYNEQNYVVAGLENSGAAAVFMQDNLSLSAKNVIRGLHYQWDPPMGKFIQAVKGSLMDVVVDIRSDSETYGKHFIIELNDRNRKQLFAPPGFAHGFRSLEDGTIAHYKCTNHYNGEKESGINPFDSFLNINWGISKQEAIVSPKDSEAQSFKDYEKEPMFRMDAFLDPLELAKRNDNDYSPIHPQIYSSDDE